MPVDARRSCARFPLASAALLLALATVAGAIGAHALPADWPALRVHVYDTAVRYQFYQSLGLLGMGAVLGVGERRGSAVNAQDAACSSRSRSMLRAAAWGVFGGTVLFCGSLYALVLQAPRWLGFVTPVGGMALICGWLLFAYGIWRR